MLAPQAPLGRQLDLVVVVVYLVAIGAVVLWLSGRQKSSKDYFVGEGSMPWWAVCFSVVATETSVLTVISVPGGAYTTRPSATSSWRWAR
jgi:Na+/proline symporter